MAENNSQPSFPDNLINCGVTFICWFYFVFAFLFFFSFFYAAAFIFSRERCQSFQYLNYLFFKGFLGLLRILTPRQKWKVDPKIKTIQGSIIVCNHLSYLDPLIFISLLPRGKSIVKTKFFKAPVFGWILKISGYLPSSTEGIHAQRMITEIENMGEFLGNGGNLFVFPEGTRKRGTVPSEFHKGVFKIARMYRCPVYVLSIHNTDKLFMPGKFFFNTRTDNCIRLKMLSCLTPADGQKTISVTALAENVKKIFEKNTYSNEDTA